MNAITIPIDDETQRKLTEICARVGWTVQDAVQDFFHKAIQEDSPVIDEMNPMYRKKNMEIIRQTIHQAQEKDFFRRAKPTAPPDGGEKLIRVTMEELEALTEAMAHE